jgi:hypothetical protein
MNNVKKVSEHHFGLAASGMDVIVNMVFVVGMTASYIPNSVKDELTLLNCNSSASKLKCSISKVFTLAYHMSFCPH